MAVDHARVDVVANDLMGTAQSLQACATEEEAEDTEFLKALDEQVFECSECGWWAGRDEEHDLMPGLCDDCGDVAEADEGDDFDDSEDDDE